MQNTATRQPQPGIEHTVPAPNDTQRVMIVNGCFGILELIEATLEAGHYDVVFVESNERAYSQIKRLQPHLVILCMRIDHLSGFQVLSMLKLDVETRDIPVLTYTMPHEGTDLGDDAPEPHTPEIFPMRPAELMN